MIRVFESAHFEKDARRLPRGVQTKLAYLLPFFKNNPFDSRLHSKPLSEPLHGLFAFRITRDWRVIFKFLSSREILLLRVRHRKDIYRL
jgi:mRNA-degrading endonuclease RelE of RelBE toxin-antitoxin system